MSDERDPVGKILRIRVSIGRNKEGITDLPFLCTRKNANGTCAGIAFTGTPMLMGWHKGAMEFSGLAFGKNVRELSWPEPDVPRPTPDAGKMAAMEARIANLEAELKALASASPAPTPTPTPAPTKRAPARKRNRNAKASGKS